MRSTFVLVATLCVSFLVSYAAPLVQSAQAVAFMGDPITEHGAATSGGYVSLAASGLTANGIDIPVTPAGIGGHRSDQMLERFDEHVLSRSPAWMTHSCDVNDLWYRERGAGVSLKNYGNLMMARGVLKAFGSKAEQLDRAKIAWRAIPNTDQALAKVALSLNELAALGQLAAAQNQSVQDLINEATNDGAKDLLKTY